MSHIENNEYQCPVCGGAMFDCLAQRVVTNATGHAIFDAEYRSCEDCEQEFVSPSQAERNDVKLREAQRPETGRVPNGGE